MAWPGPTWHGMIWHGGGAQYTYYFIMFFSLCRSILLFIRWLSARLRLNIDAFSFSCRYVWRGDDFVFEAV